MPNSPLLALQTRGPDRPVRRRDFQLGLLSLYSAGTLTACASPAQSLGRSASAPAESMSASSTPQPGSASRDAARCRVGAIDLSFHRASAGVVMEVLRQHGVQTELVVAPHERMFERLQRAEVDMVVSAWLPGSHGVYVRPMQDDLLALTVLYEPYALWGVSEHVPESAVTQVADLLKPDVLARMTRVIQGIGPGAGISRFSREIMRSYALDQVGYEFRNGTLSDCVQAFERAVAEKRWVVVPLWQPQYLHQRHRIRELKEPRGLLQGRDQATLMVRREAASRLPASALEALKQLHLGNVAVTALDDLVGRQGMDPQAAAAQWLSQHPGVTGAGKGA